MQFKHTDCTHTIKPLFKIGKADIYGGSKEEYKYFAMNREDKLGITLCLSKFDEVKIEPIALRHGHLPASLTKFTVARYPGDVYLGFDWPDLSVPNLPNSFWQPFVDYVANKITKAVYVHCMGGHGRTGTALAIMAQLAGIAGDSPIRFIRKVYCKETVESTEQVDYISNVTGIVLDDKPAKKWGGVTTTMSWEKDTPGPSYTGDAADQADSILDLIEEAKGIYKMVDHDDTQKELWEDDSVYHGDGWYWSAWGGKLHKKYDKAVAKLKKIRKIVEKEAS